MEIPQRELRNNVSEVLRRVEAGERFTITVNRRPVAELVPIAGPRTWVPTEAVNRILRDHQADAGMTRDLREALPDTTDDLDV